MPDETTSTREARPARTVLLTATAAVPTGLILGWGARAYTEGDHLFGALTVLAGVVSGVALGWLIGPLTRRRRSRRDRQPTARTPAPGHGSAAGGPPCCQPATTDWPHGQHGDLRRCDVCGEVWRLGLACPICDYNRAHVPHRGQHAVGLAWRAASGWDRLRHALTSRGER